jgi:hypothetical protein
LKAAPPLAALKSSIVQTGELRLKDGPETCEYFQFPACLPNGLPGLLPALLQKT